MWYCKVAGCRAAPIVCLYSAVFEMNDPDVFILKTLLESDGEYVSGSDLAKALAISRVGVWARLEKLRGEGFEIDAVRHRGYRLLKEPVLLHEALVRAYLERIGCDADVVIRDQIDSTNTEAERQLANERRTPFVVVARQQSSGRGRLGRRWHSPDEGNLYASFAFRPNLPPMQMQTITLWLGLQVCEYVNQAQGIPLRIKWPNDLLANGKKVAGMLTEARVDADRTRDLVFGIGLNVNGDTQQWPVEVSSVASSLAALKGQEVQISKLVAELTQVVIRAYEKYISGSFQEGFLSAWGKYDALRDLRVSGILRGREISGVARGIDRNGGLKLELADGVIEVVHSGEISLGSGQMSRAATSDPVKA